MKTKTIRIIWSLPQPIETAIESLNGNEIGLYYITRKYNGKEKSLYIGESISSIKSRLIDHNKNWVHNYSHSRIFVRLGKISYPKQNIEKAIIHAEKALIFEHGQYGDKVLFENTVSTQSYTYDDIYTIFNEGDRFELNYVVDMNGHEDI